jgi:hypothetical protein
VLNVNATLTSNNGGNIDFASTVSAGATNPVTLTVQTTGKHTFSKGTGSGVTVVNAG